MPASGAKAAEALAAAIDSFTAAGIETPRLDAEVLLAELAGVDRAALIADREQTLEAPVARAFSEAVRRRLRREPVSAAELVIFPAITLVNLVLAVLLLRNVSGGEVSVAPAHKMAPNPP